MRAIRPLLAGSTPATHFTREPGGTPVAEIIREVVLDPGIQMDAWTEAYLYAAARAEHVRHAILPRLEAGENVLWSGTWTPASPIRASGEGSASKRYAP